MNTIIRSIIIFFFFNFTTQAQQIFKIENGDTLPLNRKLVVETTTMPYRLDSTTIVTIIDSIYRREHHEIELINGEYVNETIDNIPYGKHIIQDDSLTKIWYFDENGKHTYPEITYNKENDTVIIDDIINLKGEKYFINTSFLNNDTTVYYIKPRLQTMDVQVDQTEGSFLFNDADESCDIISKLPYGTKLEVVEIIDYVFFYSNNLKIRGDWLFVKLKSNTNIQGYIPSIYLTDSDE